jgi:hypothetical protein
VESREGGTGPTVIHTFRVPSVLGTLYGAHWRIECHVMGRGCCASIRGTVRSVLVRSQDGNNLIRKHGMRALRVVYILTIAELLAYCVI